MTEPTDPVAERAPETLDERALYRRFLDKQAHVRKQREAEQRNALSKVTHETEAAMARQLGALADNGHGVCQWCNIVLGTDGEGRKTHPALRECPGPPPPACELCGRAWWFSKPSCQWTHDCAGGKRASTRRVDVDRVRTEGDGTGGFFGYRRGGHS